MHSPTPETMSSHLLIHELHRELSLIDQSMASVLIMGEKKDHELLMTWLANKFPDAIFAHTIDELSYDTQKELCEYLATKKTQGARIIASASKNFFTKVAQLKAYAPLYALLAELPLSLMPGFINQETITMLEKRVVSTAV